LNVTVVTHTHTTDQQLYTTTKVVGKTYLFDPQKAKSYTQFAQIVAENANETNMMFVCDV